MIDAYSEYVQAQVYCRVLGLHTGSTGSVHLTSIRHPPNVLDGFPSPMSQLPESFFSEVV